MICSNCGTNCAENSNFCDRCGTPLHSPYWNAQMVPMRPVHTASSSKALVSFVLSLVSLFFWPLWPIVGTLALVFACRAFAELKQNPMLGGRGFAITGLVLSIIELALFVLYLFLFLMVFSMTF